MNRADLALPDTASDPRLAPIERQILATIVSMPGVLLGTDDLGWPVLTYHDDAQPPTFRSLVAATRLPKPHVMYAVGRLEDLGYLPDPSIR